VIGDFAAVEPFDSGRHAAGEFSCGIESLDRWLQLYASQSQRRDAARTFVMADEGGAVAGYYTLVAGEVAYDSATQRVRRSLSQHFPIPVAILARLAVDRRHQGRGLGAGLLLDALQRVEVASQNVAVRAVVVHALDDAAAAFYAHHGFRPLSSEPRTLMVTLADIRAAGL
jgi:GNAT superfamily N-acetyltransferase